MRISVGLLMLLATPGGAFLSARPCPKRSIFQQATSKDEESVLESISKLEKQITEQIADLSDLKRQVGSHTADEAPHVSAEAYALRSEHTNILASRWGSEEVERVKATKHESSVEIMQDSGEDGINAAYALRDVVQMSSRWGAEEIDRVKVQRESSPIVPSHDTLVEAQEKVSDVTALKRENEELKAEILKYQTTMNSILVRSHEARLRAISATRHDVEAQFMEKILDLEDQIKSLKAGKPLDVHGSVGDAYLARSSLSEKVLGSRWGAEEVARTKGKKLVQSTEASTVETPEGPSTQTVDLDHWQTTRESLLKGLSWSR